MGLKKLKFIVFGILLLSSCVDADKDTIEIWKNEIRETEAKFSKMAAEEGIHKAFLAYAAEDAVLMRQDSLIFGKNGLDHYFLRNTSKDVKVDLKWEPDFVDVAQSGDLGYTYGTYWLTVQDSTGHQTQREGVFHTVWKRQIDGTWRFVWD